MSKSRELIDEFVSEQNPLGDGEEIRAVARVMPSADARKKMGRAAGLGGSGALALLVSQSASAKESFEHLSRNGYFAVATDRRLLFVSASPMKAHPEEVIGFISREEITSATEGSTRVSLLKLVTASIECRNGSSVYCEFAKPDSDDGRALIRALST